MPKGRSPSLKECLASHNARTYQVQSSLTLLQFPFISPVIVAFMQIRKASMIRTERNLKTGRRLKKNKINKCTYVRRISFPLDAPYERKEKICK